MECQLIVLRLAIINNSYFFKPFINEIFEIQKRTSLITGSVQLAIST